MGLFSVTAPPQPILSTSSSSSRKFAIDAHSFSSARSIAASTNLNFTGFTSQTSVRAAPKSNQVRAQAVAQESQSKDDDLVFVAGATGRVGSRTVRELLKLGFRVRAGVRNAVKAEPLLQSVRQIKVDNEASVVEKLELVECDLERDRIEPAIGNASVLFPGYCSLYYENFEFSEYVAFNESKAILATISGVKHFILLTSLGTNKIGFPAAILKFRKTKCGACIITQFPPDEKVELVSSVRDIGTLKIDSRTEITVDDFGLWIYFNAVVITYSLFWGVLLWKRKAEEALIKSGLPYTIVRPGGMERPTDAYKETHNIFLSKEDTLFGGQVSNLQVAELMSFMAKNRGLSYCKVVEVIAETTAPLTPMEELLAQIPSQRQDSSLLKKSQTESELDSSPSKVSSEAKIYVIDEPTQAEVPRSQPLSPYIVYDDLKPPTSPSPTPPSSTSIEQELSKVAAQINLSDSKAVIAETKSVQFEIQERRPQSPYTVYEDLKPPTSPTPTPSKQ
ncbi:hypothetical protein Scep_000807 [Stephania cephalantha]|uniref:NAD(P)-binding domain-containing protein n=1 Tax=Stephania cephalantha TaxID=152367 RepID=A0AAP0L7B5_9MAGN